MLMPPGAPPRVKVCEAVMFTLREYAANFSMNDRVWSAGDALTAARKLLNAADEHARHYNDRHAVLTVRFDIEGGEDRIELDQRHRAR